LIVRRTLWIAPTAGVAPRGFRSMMADLNGNFTKVENALQAAIWEAGQRLIKRFWKALEADDSRREVSWAVSTELEN